MGSWQKMGAFSRFEKRILRKIVINFFNRPLPYLCKEPFLNLLLIDFLSPWTTDWLIAILSLVGIIKSNSILYSAARSTLQISSTVSVKIKCATFFCFVSIIAKSSRDNYEWTSEMNSNWASLGPHCPLKPKNE